MFQKFCWLAVFILVLPLSEAGTSISPIWAASSLFKAGAVTFSFTGSLTYQTSTITYSSAMTNSTLKTPVLGITDLRYIMSSAGILLQVVYQNKTSTSLTFSVTVDSNSNLKTLKLTYLAIDNAFTPATSLSYLTLNPYLQGPNLVYQVYINFTASTGVILNTSHENVMLPFLHYMDIDSYDGTIDIDLNFTLVNGSYYTLIVKSDSDIMLNKIAISRMIFDKTAIEAMGSDYFDYGIVTSTDNNATALSTTIPPNILPANLFFGMHSFTITTGLSQLNFNSTYNTTSGFIGLMPQGTFVFSQMKFSYFHHKYRTCPGSNPYYNISEKLCYDSCATVNWFAKSSTMTCNSCLYDCYTCTNASSCTSCQTNITNRQTNGTRCSPIPGYYDDGSSLVAPACGGSCLTCSTSATFCLSCPTNYILSSNTCKACSTLINNCANCTSATVCTVCTTTFTLFSATNCSCKTTQYLSSGQCFSCSAAITNCSACSSATSCSSCATSFTLVSATNCSCKATEYLTSGSCNSCSAAVANCNACSSATNCTSCASTFTLFTATNCSCASGYYLSSGQCKLCSLSITNCSACTSSTICTACDTTFTLVSATNCSCKSTQYLSGGKCYSCSAAISNCNACSSATSCTSCATSFTFFSVSNCSCKTTEYLTSGLCNSCSTAISNCNTCSSATNCTSCASTFTLFTGTNCSCASGYYLSSGQCKLCSLSITNCSACNSSTTCTACDTTFTLVSATNCSCKSTQYLSGGKCYSCSAAISNCNACSSATSCSSCATSFTLISSTNCSCKSTEYLTSGLCNSCSIAIAHCMSCSNSSSCTTCDSSFTLLSPSNCGCTSTQYLNTTANKCQSCTLFATYCQSCSNATCTTCMSTFTLLNATCVCGDGTYFNSSTSNCQSCSSAIPNCKKCSAYNVCTVCSTNYDLNSTTFACDYSPPPCYVANCDTCVTNAANQCMGCSTGYSVDASGLCQRFCGNNALDSTQQCDDGNLIQRDGCSSTCHIETGFTCYNQSINSTNTYTYCFFSQKINFSNIWTLKIQGKNAIKVLFQLGQLLYQWRTVNFTQAIAIDYRGSRLLSTAGVIASYTAQYQPDTNRFWVIINYVTPLQSKNLVFQLDPYQNGTYPAFTPPDNVTFLPQLSLLYMAVVANNNQKVDVYSPQQYGLYSISVVATYTIITLAVLALVISVLFRTGRVIALQMISLLQITYFSLTFIDSMSPVFSGLLPLRYLAGILTLRDIQQYLYQTTAPNAMKGTYMFVDLSQNMSWGSLAFCVSIGLGLLFGIIYKIYAKISHRHDYQEEDIPSHERKGQKLRRLAFYFLGEMSLSLVILFLPVYTLSLFYQILYNIDSFDLLNFAYALGFGFAFVVFFIALIRSKLKDGKHEVFTKLGEFINEFSCEGGFKKFKYWNFQIIEILILAGLVMLTIYTDSKLFSPICIIMISIIDIIIVGVAEPYRFGFASCCRGKRTAGIKSFSKIQLSTLRYIPSSQINNMLPDLANEWQRFKHSKKQMKQEQLQKKSSSQKNPEQPVEEQSNQKPLFFNNNSRRIINLSILILIEGSLVCVRIYDEQLNSSQGGINIENSLPLLILLALTINVIYNYLMLIFQILDSNRQKVVKIYNEKNSESMEHNRQIQAQPSKQVLDEQTIQPQTKSSDLNDSNFNNKTKHLIVTDSSLQNIYDFQRPRVLKKEKNKAARKKRMSAAGYEFEE